MTLGFSLEKSLHAWAKIGYINYMDSSSSLSTQKGTAMNTFELIREIMALRNDLSIVTNSVAKNIIQRKLATREQQLIKA